MKMGVEQEKMDSLFRKFDRSLLSLFRLLFDGGWRGAAGEVRRGIVEVKLVSVADTKPASSVESSCEQQSK